MKFMLVEGVRRLLQMFFGMTIFELPVLRSLRLLAYRLVFDIAKNPAYISNCLEKVSLASIVNINDRSICSIL